MLLGHWQRFWLTAPAQVKLALGGVLGGAAYAINIASYKSSMPAIFKIILNIVVGGAALVLWMVITAWLHTQLK